MVNEEGGGAVAKAVARAEQLSKSAIEAAEASVKAAQEEIAKAETMVTRLQKIEEKRALQAEETRKEEDKKTTYIS